MTNFKKNNIINSLTKKGFRPDNRGHKYLYFYVNGKNTGIFTFVSWGSNEINDYLIGKMSFQVRLEKKQFIDLIECPLSEEEYIAELIRKGELSK